MKYLLGLLVLIILAVLVWPGVSIRPTPHGRPVEAAPSGREAISPTPPAAPVPPTIVPERSLLAGPKSETQSSEGDVNSLQMPVQGVVAEGLTDTFTDARSEGRSHHAIDIMAPAGTPVLAVADGHIEKLFTSERGGLTIYQFEPSGRVAYYYAHLQSYAPNLVEQQQIKRGQVIGYVGSTGNASPQAPHLHFAVFLLGPEKRWWEGQAINPYPLLTNPRP